MKTLLNVIALLTWVILMSITWCNPERMVWKVVLTAIVLYVGIVVIWLIQAKEIPDENMDL